MRMDAPNNRTLIPGVVVFLLVFLGVPAAPVLYEMLETHAVTPAQRLTLGWSLILLLPGAVLHPLTIASLSPWYARLSAARFTLVEALTAGAVLAVLSLPMWAGWIFLAVFVVPPLVTLAVAWAVHRATGAHVLKP